MFCCCDLVLAFVALHCIAINYTRQQLFLFHMFFRTSKTKKIEDSFLGKETADQRRRWRIGLGIGNGHETKERQRVVYVYCFLCIVIGLWLPYRYATNKQKESATTIRVGLFPLSTLRCRMAFLLVPLSPRECFVRRGLSRSRHALESRARQERNTRRHSRNSPKAFVFVVASNEQM